MVGIPRSRGCLLCVRRRVRCDEQRPGCARCVSYGAECPGYERGLKFVSGKHHVRKRGAAAAAAAAAVPAAVASTSSTASTAAAASDKHRPDAEAKGLPSGTRASSGDWASSSACLRSPGQTSLSSARSTSPSTLSPHALPYRPGTTTAVVTAAVTAAATDGIPPQLPADRAALVSGMLQLLNVDSRQPRALPWGAWLQFVPEHVGHKATLDSAVCCFAMHLEAKSRGNADLLVQSRHVYGQSLAALQCALRHPHEWRASETLCSAMLLCIFELFADTSGRADSWQKHAKGISHLIEQRDIASYESRWDCSMLFSFRTIIIVNDLFAGQPCFLAKSKWRRVMARMATFGDGPLSMLPARMLPIVNMHIVHMARLPSVLQMTWTIRQARLHGLPVDLALVALLQRSAASLHASFTAWFASARYGVLFQEPPYDEVPSQMLGPLPLPPSAGGAATAASDYPISPYPTVLAYREPWIGALYLNHLSCLLIVQEGLNQCAVCMAERAAQTSAAGAADAALSDLQSDFFLSPSPLPPPSQPAAATVALRPYEDVNRQYCRIIYRSIESVGQGIMGPYRIGFALRIAYEFADIPTQLWIRALLDRSSATYSSSRADTFPPVLPNGYGYN